MWSFILPLIDRPTNFVARGHFGMLLFGCFVWALLAEHYKVTSVEETLPRADRRARRLLGLLGHLRRLAGDSLLQPEGRLPARAVRFQHVCNAASPRYSFARPFVPFAGAARTWPGPRNCWLSAQTSLLWMLPSDCNVFPSLHATWPRSYNLPGQEIVVENSRVYELESWGAQRRTTALKEAVIAIPPEQFSLIPGIISRIEQAVPAGRVPSWILEKASSCAKDCFSSGACRCWT